MGMPCPKCGTDNLLNAIFCRGCGEKLDLNAMKPEALMADDKKKPGSTKGQKIFLSIFGGVLLLLIIGLVCPAGGTFKAGEVSPELNASFQKVQNGNAAAKKKKKKKGEKKAAEEEKPAEPSASSFTFSSADATSLISKAMNLPSQSTEGAVPQNFSIGFLENNVVRVVLTCKVFGFLPMDNVVTVKITCAGKGSVTTEVLGAKIGQLPMFGGLTDIVLNKVQPMIDSCNALNKIKGKAKSFTTTKDSATIGI